MVAPMITIVIVNYNAGPLLRQAVESVAEQTLDAYELLIIDNASTDGSLSTISRGRPIGERCRIIRNSINTGFAAAQNQGFRIGGGRYCMSLNFDVRLSRDYLEKSLAAMESTPRLGMLSGKLLRMSPDWKPTSEIDNAGLLLPHHRRPVHRGGAENDAGQYERPVLVFGVMGAAAIYRRAMLEEVAFRDQPFDESYFMWYEDIDLDWRARLLGWDCLYLPSAVAYHIGDVHGHGRSDWGAQNGICNRWSTIISNECPHCFLRHAWDLLKEEASLLMYVIRFGKRGPYLRAVQALAHRIPHLLEKRRWVRRHARRRCLPEYPAAF